MNQSMFYNVSQHTLKTQIIKQIRELDWARETLRPDILMQLHSLEIACLARASEKESEKVLALKAYIHHAFFISSQTENKFKELIMMYSELLPSYRAFEKMKTISDTNDIKTFDDEIEGNNFEGYYDLDYDIYNPLAVAHNDKVDMQMAIDVLTSIENKISLDWLEGKAVAPIKPLVEPFVEPVKPILAAVQPILVPQRVSVKKAMQTLEPTVAIVKAFGILLLTTTVMFTLAVFAVYAGPAIVAVAAAFSIKAALAAPAAAIIGMGIVAGISTGIGMIFDTWLKKLSRKQKLSVSAGDRKDNEESPSIAIATEPNANLEPINDNIHVDPAFKTALAANDNIHLKPASENTFVANDNIHQDPSADDAAALETPLVANLSASKHSLFHTKKEIPIEPTQILVRNITRHR